MEKLEQTFGFKWNMDKPFMSEAESNMFQKLRRANKISMFRIARCTAVRQDEEQAKRDKKPLGQCDGEVPDSKDEEGNLIKKYCSLACYRVDHPEQETHDESETDW